MRVGWVIELSNAIACLRLIRKSTDLYAGYLAQAILAEYVRRGLLDRHLGRTRKAYSSHLGVSGFE